MSKLSVEMKEFDEFIKKLNKLDVENFNKQFLLKEGIRCVGIIKKNTPTITGALKASWGLGSENFSIATNLKTGKVVAVDKSLASVDDVNEGYEIEIWNGMIYASQVENGRFDEQGNQTSEGRKMAAKGLNAVNKAMPNRYKRDLKNHFKEAGVGE